MHKGPKVLGSIPGTTEARAEQEPGFAGAKPWPVPPEARPQVGEGALYSHPVQDLGPLG